MQEVEYTRVDKWLWAVRLFKTRSLATQACRNGAVKMSGDRLKPSHAVRPGEVYTAKTGDTQRTVKVLQIAERRVSAKQVPELFEDLTPPSELERRREKSFSPPALRPRGSGRPTKKERRALSGMFSEGNFS